MALLCENSIESQRRNRTTAYALAHIRRRANATRSPESPYSVTHREGAMPPEGSSLMMGKTRLFIYFWAEPLSYARMRVPEALESCRRLSTANALRVSRANSPVRVSRIARSTTFRRGDTVSLRVTRRATNGRGCAIAPLRVSRRGNCRRPRTRLARIAFRACAYRVLLASLPAARRRAASTRIACMRVGHSIEEGDGA